jgi:hypothetical protein
MESTIKTNVIQSNATITRKRVLFSPAFLATAEYNRFGIVPAVLTIVICLTAFAAAFAIQIGIGALVLIAVPTAFFISTIIAGVSMKTIFALTGFTIAADVVVFLFIIMNS